jgi:hypothetical protein
VLYALATGFAFIWPLGAILIQILVLLIFFLRSPSRHAAHAEDRQARRAASILRSPIK